MTDKRITSVDDLLRFFGVTIDYNLPDPEMIDSPMYRRPVLPDNKATISDDPETLPESFDIEFEDFRKERIVFEGRVLWFWSKV